jgi:Galactose-3-O-sulfotransferase
MHSSGLHRQDWQTLAKPTDEQATTKPTIIFLHMPRSGGTTLNRLIEWEYGPMSVFAVDPHFYRWSYNTLTRSRAFDIPHLKALQGHMPFGVHALLNTPATYITMLRDPIDRVISEYYFRLHHPRRHPREHREVKTLGLEEYIRTTPRHNVQTKLAAGCRNGYDFLEGECTADTLALAKHNLSRHFSLVGLTERFDESLALAKVMFGWEIRRHGSFHVERRRPQTDRVPAGVRDLIRDRYRYDVALYEYGVTLFNEALAKHAAQVRVEVERIRKARNLSAVESISFRARSFAFKTISRMRSAALVVAARTNSRRRDLAG